MESQDSGADAGAELSPVTVDAQIHNFIANTTIRWNLTLDFDIKLRQLKFGPINRIFW